jgi:hypothetical protein
MLVLGDEESDSAEKVVEKRELELEERWNMPICTMLIQLFLDEQSVLLRTSKMPATMPDQQRIEVQGIDRTRQ